MLLQFLHTAASTVYTYNYTTTSTSGSSFWGTYFLLLALVWVISIIALWKVFTKAGRPGWAAIIPFYNSWVLFEISGKPGWWAFVAIIPFVGWLIAIVLYIIAMLELAKRFGKSQTFAVVGMIIFSFIGLLILGYGDAKYSAGGGTAAPTPAAPVV